MTAHFFGVAEDSAWLTAVDLSDFDLIIPGETVDWTICEYVWDANGLGKPKALLNVGHFNWEDPGMEYMLQ